MSLEENKALARRYYEEVLSQGNMVLFDEICLECAPAGVLISGVIEPTPQGMDGARQLVQDFRAGFSDIRFIVGEQIAEGHKVATQVTVEGTNDGALFGMPPTGKHMRAAAMSLITIANGQIASEQVHWDALGAYRQLGLIPAPGSAGG